MIRAKELFKKFKHSLEDEIIIEEDPTRKKLLFPLDRIQPPLYKANPEIHKLQKDLAVQRDYSIQEIKKAHEIVSPAEKAVEFLVKTSNVSLDYVKAAAKVTDAGDKLDKIILNEINKLEKRFNEGYKKARKWKPEYDFDKIDTVRNELRAITGRFFAFEEIYDQRSLPEKKIKSAKAAFSDYKEKLAMMSRIDSEIGSIIKEYQEISSLVHLKDFVKESKNRFRKTLFKDTLMNRCIAADYKEGIAYIKNLEKDMNYVLANFSKRDKIGNVKDRIVRNTNRVLEAYRAVKGLQEVNLSLDDLQRLQSIRKNVNEDKYQQYERLIYLKKLISEYKKAAFSLETKASKLIQHEVANSCARYNLIESKSKETPGSISEIDDYVSLVNVMNDNLNRIGLKFHVLGDGGNSKKVDALSKENKKKVEELRNIAEAYAEIQKVNEEVSFLYEEVKGTGVTAERIDEIATFKEFRPLLNTKYENLKQEYNDVFGKLTENFKSLVDSSLRSIDEKYDEAMQNSGDLNYVLRLYERFNKVTDVSDKIYKTKVKIEEIKKQAEEEKAKKEYEAKIQQLQSEKQDYEGQIKNLSTGLSKAERELATSNGKAVELENELRNKAYEKDDIVSEITTNSQNDGSFILCDYLRESPEPSAYCLSKLKDILQGRTGEQNLFERLNQFSDYLSMLKSVNSEEDKKFLNYLFEGLKKDVSNGSLGRKIGASSYRRSIVNDTLNLVKSRLAA